MQFLSQPTALVGAIALAMGFSTLTSAQTVESTNNVNAKLDTLVVTATRSEEKIENVPARISIIEPQVLDQSPIAELPHLLMQDAAINMVQSGGFGQQSSIFTRGTNSTHTLVMRDGVRINAASAGMASLAFLDTTELKQIEILKGPASVLYGTDAIGGVIQLISKTPDQNSAFITTEVGEHQTYKSLVGADLYQDGFYAQVRGQRLETDGTPILDRPEASQAGYDQKGLSVKLGIEKRNYSFSADYNQNHGSSLYDNYGALIPQNFKNEQINLKGRVNLNQKFSLNARLSQFKDDLDQQSQPEYVHNTTQEAELYGQWHYTPHQNLLLGSTYKHLDADVLSPSASGDEYSVDYHQASESTGYYLQHQYQGEKLNTQLGARIEQHSKFGTHAVGQLGVRYQVLPSTSVYTNIGSAFRAPTNNDLYALNWGGNPDLKPEESFSYEVGLDQKLGQYLTASLSVYRNQVEHLITYTDILHNIDQSTFTGGELNLNWQKDALFVNLGYAYVQAKNDDTGIDLTRRPRHSATLSTGWQSEHFGLSTSVSAKSHSTDFADWPSTTPTINPGYVTLDVNGYWNVTPYLKLFSNIQNVGDVHYKTAYNGEGVYYINGGRLASVGVTLKY